MRTSVIPVVVLVIVALLISNCLLAMKLSRDSRLEREVSAIRDQVHGIHAEFFANVSPTTKSSSEEGSQLPGIAEDVQLHSLADVNEYVKKLGDASSAQKLSDSLAELDMWLVPSADEEAFRDLKLRIASQLRQQVENEVQIMQKAALEAGTGAEAARQYSEAGRILSLYPMSEDRAVLEKAKLLSSSQAEVANRLEVLRRQRYNYWVTEQIQNAIDGYNKGSSYWSPKKENKVLMESLVDNLKEIDPTLLEPAVMELYNYVVDLTKGSISENEKFELAKRLTEPSIKRRTLGDF